MGLLRGILGRLREAGARGGTGEEAKVAALASRLGASEADARWILRRARQVGFGAAMGEFEVICRNRAAGREDGAAPTG